jgi:hypothetical protein
MFVSRESRENNSNELQVSRIVLGKGFSCGQQTENPRSLYAVGLDF